MHIIFRLLACFVGFSAFLTISVAQATDYYVSTSGNDSNAGTQAAPFRTIQKGSEVVQAGDTVHVLPGTYIETRKGSNFAGIQQRNKGTASNRIRFVSDTRWGAKVSTRGTTTTMWAVMGDYVDIEGFEVDGTDANAGPGIMLYGDKGRILYNHVHHILPPACHGAIGIDSGDYNGSGSEVIGNLIHDTKPNVTPCNLSGYAIYFASPNGKVMNNIFIILCFMESTCGMLPTVPLFPTTLFSMLMANPELFLAATMHLMYSVTTSRFPITLL